MQFLRYWQALIDLEDSLVVDMRRELWLLPADSREEVGRSVSITSSENSASEGSVDVLRT